MLASFLLLALAAVSAHAHSVMQQIHVDGKAQGALKGIRVPKTNSPVIGVTTKDIQCNANLRTPLPKDVIAINGGSKVGLEWHRTIGQLSSDVISKSHRGPIQVYMAKIADATQSDLTGLQWFKIADQGYDHASNTWATDDLIKNKGIFEFTMPSCIEAGDYIMRSEIIALHNADKPSGAQPYVECANVKVSGTSGSANPSTVSFPGAYSSSDPGIKFNIYKSFTSYPIPGPDVFSCNGSNSSNSTANTTTDAAAATSTTKTKTTKTKAQTTTTAGSVVAAAVKESTSGSKCRAKRGHA